MTVRSVKPFVDQLTVPYFMDLKLIRETMAERQCSLSKARAILQTRWMKEPGHGH